MMKGFMWFTIAVSKQFCIPNCTSAQDKGTPLTDLNEGAAPSIAIFLPRFSPIIHPRGRDFKIKKRISVFLSTNERALRAMASSSRWLVCRVSLGFE